MKNNIYLIGILLATVMLTGCITDVKTNTDGDQGGGATDNGQPQQMVSVGTEVLSCNYTDDYVGNEVYELSFRITVQGTTVLEEGGKLLIKYQQESGIISDVGGDVLEGSLEAGDTHTFEKVIFIHDNFDNSYELGYIPAGGSYSDTIVFYEGNTLNCQ